MDYVAGFMLGHGHVVLVLKQRPSAQKGLLNAVGGKVEQGETAAEAMRREFREEAGLDIEDWGHDSVLHGPGFRVDFFSCEGDVDQVRTLTDEAIEVVSVESVLLRRRATMRNLPLMLSVALDRSGIVRPVEFHDGIPQP